MPLTWNQKHNLGILTGMLVVLLFFSGIGWLVYWSCQTTSVTHICNGTTGYVITTTHGNGDGVTVKTDDPSCR